VVVIHNLLLTKSSYVLFITSHSAEIHRILACACSCTLTSSFIKSFYKVFKYDALCFVSIKIYFWFDSLSSVVVQNSLILT
jgi:hypothetical protein